MREKYELTESQMFTEDRNFTIAQPKNLIEYALQQLRRKPKVDYKQNNKYKNIKSCKVITVATRWTTK